MNTISSNTPVYTGVETTTVASDSATKKEEKAENQKTAAASGQNNAAAVYESSSKESADSSKKIYKPNTALVEQLKKDAEQRAQQLQSLVEKMLVKQGQTVTSSLDMFALLREGKLNVDDATRKQAQQDISEDGYWGVKQTSDRLVSFAIALTGGDTSKADTMIKAMEKGFRQATKSWGDELPDICQRTIDAAREKMNKWKNGKLTADDVAAPNTKNQTTANKTTSDMTDTNMQ